MANKSLQILVGLTRYVIIIFYYYLTGVFFTIEINLYLYLCILFRLLFHLCIINDKMYGSCNLIAWLNVI